MDGARDDASWSPPWPDQAMYTTLPAEVLALVVCAIARTHVRDVRAVALTCRAWRVAMAIHYDELDQAIRRRF